MSNQSIDDYSQFSIDEFHLDYWSVSIALENQTNKMQIIMKSLKIQPTYHLNYELELK